MYKKTKKTKATNTKMLQQLKQSKGITLIALVITIIVLLILAGITIALIAGQDSAPQKAVQARIENDKGAARDAATMLVAEKTQGYYEDKYVKSPATTTAANQLAYIAEKLGSGATTGDYTVTVTAAGAITVTKGGEELATGTVSNEGVISWSDSNSSGGSEGGSGGGSGSGAGGNTAQAIEVPAAGSTFVALSSEKNVKVKDTNNKEIIVPVGFRISPNSGTTIEQGIVIEDENHNEFVWVPVGTEVTYSSTYNSSTLKTALGETATSGTITLGRYDFGTSDSRKQELKSSASGTTANDVIGTYFTESASAFTIGSKTYQPSVAKNITDFINKTNSAKGYYIGRYEAGKGTNDVVVCKQGATVYNSVYRGGVENYSGALELAQGMYTDAQKKGKYECDLVNSYAWDTAIVYIEKCGTNSNYAFQNRLKSGSDPYSTGASDDEQCKIQDMASNVNEWTTEYSSVTLNSGTCPCVTRGGYFGYSHCYTSTRGSGETINSDEHIGFRPLIYVSSAES